MTKCFFDKPFRGLTNLQMLVLPGVSAWQ